MRAWIAKEVLRIYLESELSQLEAQGATIFTILDGGSTRRDYVLVVAYVEPKPEPVVEDKPAKDLVAPAPAKPKKSRKK